MPTFVSNGTSTAALVEGVDIAVFAVGTFGSGTLHVETYGDDNSWHSVSTLTSDGYLAFKNKGRHGWRLRLAGATSPSIWYEIRAASDIFIYGEAPPTGAAAVTGYAPTLAIT